MAREKGKGYRTQWSAQFFAGAELTRKGYKVAFTYGNCPRVDMYVESPNGVPFMVDVKGLSIHTFWPIKPCQEDKDLYFILVLVPATDNPRYFVLSSRDLNTEIQKYKDYALKEGLNYKPEWGGFNWSYALPYEDRWDVLPS